MTMCKFIYPSIYLIILIIYFDLITVFIIVGRGILTPYFLF